MKLDEAIKHYNDNRDPDTTPMDRITLGRMIFIGHTDPTINSSLSRWTREEYKPLPHPEQLVQIANITGVSLDYLFRRTINPNNKK